MEPDNPFLVMDKDSFKVIFTSYNIEEVKNYMNKPNVIVIRLLDFLVKFKREVEEKVGLRNWLLINKIVKNNSIDNSEEDEYEDSPCIDCDSYERICQYCSDIDTTRCHDCNPCEFCDYG